MAEILSHARDLGAQARPLPRRGCAEANPSGIRPCMLMEAVQLTIVCLYVLTGGEVALCVFSIEVAIYGSP